MPHPDSKVAFIKDYDRSTKPARKRAKVKSQYDKHQLPFFDKASLSTWSVKPTGNYSADCQTGHAYALEFLRSCDRTVGWTSLLGQMVTDMIGAGPVETWPNGRAKASGLVIGFMRTISQALCFVDPAEVTLIESQHGREAAWVREEMARLRAGTEGT
jgi:hypothetical protein